MLDLRPGGGTFTLDEADTLWLRAQGLSPAAYDGEPPPPRRLPRPTSNRAAEPRGALSREPRRASQCPCGVRRGYTFSRGRWWSRPRASSGFAYGHDLLARGRRAGEGDGIGHRRGALGVDIVVAPDPSRVCIADRGGELHIGGGGHEEPEVTVEAAAVEHLAELFLVSRIEERRDEGLVAKVRTDLRLDILARRAVVVGLGPHLEATALQACRRRTHHAGVLVADLHGSVDGEAGIDQLHCLLDAPQGPRQRIA